MPYSLCNLEPSAWWGSYGGDGSYGATAGQGVQQAADRYFREGLQRYGFTEYALIEQTDEGLLIKPLKVEDERISLDVLRRLIVEGCEGEALVGC